MDSSIRFSTWNENTNNTNLENLNFEQLFQSTNPEKIHAACVAYCDSVYIDQDKKIDPQQLAALAEIVDKMYDKQHSLIRPSHDFYRYSLTRKISAPQKTKKYDSEDNALERLHQESETRAFEIVIDYHSDNTRAAHENDLKYWQAWLSAIGFDFNTSITESEVLSFIVQHTQGLDDLIDTQLVEQGYKTKKGSHRLATIKRRIGSLSVFLRLKGFDNPCKAESVRKLCEKLTKKFGSSQPSGKAITKDILNDMITTCTRDTLHDKRDRALLLFGWGSGGRRRSEIVAADIKDLVTTHDGNFIYTIPRSKNDQKGKGHAVPLKGRVAEALKIWLAASGITEGKIFRSVTKYQTLGSSKSHLSDNDIWRIVRARLKKAGYNEKEYCAHSLRSGFVTEAGRQNKNIGDVMQMTTHRNVSSVMKYYQSGNIINNSASNLADEK